MKKIITLFGISLFTFFAIHAATWTVSNNPDIPGQFTQISEAIASASTSAGDTLLVAGSPNRYANFTVSTKYFVIIGAGMHNPYGYQTWVDNVTLSTATGFTPSGTVISGLWIDANLNFNTSAGSKTMENIVIERCWLDYYVSFNGDGGSTYRNITIRNCIKEDYHIWWSNIGTIEDVEIHNNLFDNAIFSMDYRANLYDVTTYNNVFINEGSNIFGGVKNMVVHDNIFMKANPQGCSGCTFNYNTSYGSINDTLVRGTNIGSENKIRDPKFENYTVDNGEFTWEAGYDYHLRPESDDDDSGTGGGQRGMYGGPTPVELGSNPPIPQMTEVSFTDNASSVKEEGTLKVKFKAKKQD